MAKFEKGEYITAEKLNAINREKAFYPDSKYGATSLYMHHDGFIKWWAVGWGAQTAKVEIYRLVEGKYVTVFSREVRGDYEFGGGEPINSAEEGTVFINALGGEGYYMMQGWYMEVTESYITDEGHMSDYRGITYGYLEAYPFADAIKGEYLVQFDLADRSGNRIKGNQLTAEILNSGTVGTIPVLI